MNNMLRIVVAQLNFLVGDIEENAEKIINNAKHAKEHQDADLVVFSEMALCGYPPQDLLLRSDFKQRIELALQKIVAEVKDVYVVIGYPEYVDIANSKPDIEGLAARPFVIYNSAAVIYNGAIVANYRKQLLPNSGVFDEKRYFIPGDESCLFALKGRKIAVAICEDVWFSEPLAKARILGADLALVLNASPFDIYKQLAREKIVAKRACEQSIPIVYVNAIGGQDDLVFDGGSFVVNAEGKVVKRIESFMEKRVEVDFSTDGELSGATSLFGYGSTEQRVYDALVLAVLDYVEKNNFSDVVIGLSGGIDSALTLAIAVDALGEDRVHTVFMPSKYSSKMSFEDAEKIAQNFKVTHYRIAIDSIWSKFRKRLKSFFKGTAWDVTEENLQARIRGTLLMALSNKKGWLVLTTGNKSELAIGYATLYGDMAGGFSPLKDVFKTLVYQLAEYRNNLVGFDIIPRRIIDRAPTAELHENQLDSDTLPPYVTLDPILERYIEQDRSVEEICADGFDVELVEAVIKQVNRNEYKRRQAALGPKISVRAFDKDRRYPITRGPTSSLGVEVSCEEESDEKN